MGDWNPKSSHVIDDDGCHRAKEESTLYACSIHASYLEVLHCGDGCNAVVAKARWKSEGSIPLEIGRPKAHMPPAIIMGVTDEKKRACVMLVFSMPSTQEAKCIASAAPDSSIRRPLCCVCFLSSAATHSVNKRTKEALTRLGTTARCPWPSCPACGRRPTLLRQLLTAASANRSFEGTASALQQRIMLSHV